MAFIRAAVIPRRARRHLATDGLSAPARRERTAASRRAARWKCREAAESESSSADNDEIEFRPHAPAGDDSDEGVDSDHFLPVELVDGYLDNAKVRPKIDIDADEYMLMWKLRKMLHEDDFKKIFDPKSRRIGEL